MTEKQPIVTTTTGRRLPTLPAGLMAFIVDSQDRILMLSNPKSNGRWEPINGALDPNETFLEGLMREIREEAGLEIRVRPLGVIHTYTFRWDENVPYVTSLAYLFEYLGGNVIPGDDMTDSQVAWFSLDELNSDQVEILVPREVQMHWIYQHAIDLYHFLKDKPENVLQPDITRDLPRKYPKTYNYSD